MLDINSQLYYTVFPQIIAGLQIIAALNKRCTIDTHQNKCRPLISVAPQNVALTRNLTVIQQ